MENAALSASLCGEVPWSSWRLSIYSSSHRD
jgi:hypothetical protein